MIRILVWILPAMLLSVQALAQEDAKPPQSLKEKASYVMGRDIVKDLNDRLVEYDLEQLIAGIRAAATGKASLLSEEDIESVMKTFARDLEKRQAQQLQEQADKNMRAGQQFAKENALKEGVKQLENGIQYEILVAGEGPSPKIADRVKVHFEGKTLEGKTFESTLKEKEPTTLAVGGIGIRGVLEAVLRMKVGSKWRVAIPPDLAYGVAGAPPDIGPNQTLIFEIELLEIVK